MHNEVKMKRSVRYLLILPTNNPASKFSWIFIYLILHIFVSGTFETLAVFDEIKIKWHGSIANTGIFSKIYQNEKWKMHS